MCGIVGAVAERQVLNILLEGLKRQEYRGYDSAGIALINNDGELHREREVGKVQNLVDVVAKNPVNGTTGIAHTRWATHGGVTQPNAHPHVSNNSIAMVHNGIIENHEQIKVQLKEWGYQLDSQTDSETIAHLIHHEMKNSDSLVEAVQKVVPQLEGAYGTVVLNANDKSNIVVARSGSPLVIGLGIGENFIASAILALLPVTNRFIYLEEGDVAEVTRETIRIFDVNGALVERDVHTSDASHEAGDKGDYRHFMMKEICEQPTSIRSTLEGRLDTDTIRDTVFGESAKDIFEKVEHIQIIAC
ncbi:MAG: class II glutamine amidotransferase, partial [Psychrosphaera sp.]|nr:class II glutamine amidotransferase [Psychrosphaera sp.]